MEAKSISLCHISDMGMELDLKIRI